MRPLADRQEATMPALRQTKAHEVLAAIKARLNRAYNEGLLVTSSYEISRSVALVQPPEEFAKYPEAAGIAGGEKDRDRRPESARLKRSDGAWFHLRSPSV